jgi:methyl-accepting chemotaxis protein
MKSDTAHLQRLTDEQVSARLAAYNADGSLERDVALLRENIGDIIETEVGDSSVATPRGRCRHIIPAGSTPPGSHEIAEYGRRLYAEKTPVPTYIAARNALIARVLSQTFERFARQPDLAQDCARALQRLVTIETDIILAQIALLEAIDAADARGRAERGVRAPRCRPGPRQHRTVEEPDRPHAFDRGFGSWNARKNQRGRRRGRAVGGRDA